MADEERRLSPLLMDRSDPVGNTEDIFGRKAHHVKVGNKLTEPIPVVGTFTAGSASTPTIVNVTAILANTEYSYALPSATKRFSLKARGNARIQFSYTLGQSGTTFVTVPPGASYNESDLGITGKTIYFQSSKAGEIVEILSWV